MPNLPQVGPPSELVLIAAAEVEYQAIAKACGSLASPTGTTALGPGVTLHRVGVGKVNAAIGTSRVLLGGRGSGGALVVSVGIGGALPAGGGFAHALLDVVVAQRSCYGDEGKLTPDGFVDCWAMGFPPGDFPASGIAGDAWLVGAELRGAGWRAVRGAVATVSTCSGTDALAAEIARRTGATVEAMEGAAVGQAVRALGAAGEAARFGELRVISNTTGDAGKQVWQIRPALERLGAAAAALVQCVVPA
jgi:futalosine hydrolase